MLVNELVQLLGVLCLVVGLTWALGPVVLIVGGLALLVVPELLSAARSPAEQVEEGRRS